MQLSDVNLNIRGRVFPAHRSILATGSEVFAAMFQPLDYYSLRLSICWIDWKRNALCQVDQDLLWDARRAWPTRKKGKEYHQIYCCWAHFLLFDEFTVLSYATDPPTTCCQKRVLATVHRPLCLAIKLSTINGIATKSWDSRANISQTNAMAMRINPRKKRIIPWWNTSNSRYNSIYFFFFWVFRINFILWLIFSGDGSFPSSAIGSHKKCHHHERWGVSRHQERKKIVCFFFLIHLL